ncbi:Pentatricopeptide repeat [Thalictrum thalictroides]|uniref:Pentatricopeptide repeat n=1 Tax=Thalictrum thalictroides TaxID=46969 RepID=A0A7J6XB27_THATH|nr:Pentatricopeptide repeat [Thalictrum thalictroides]
MAEKLFDKMPWKDTAAWNSMVFGYCCNGRTEDACKLFEKMPYRNVISWTTMIGGFDQCGRSDEALLLFQKMCLLGVKPTSSTYSCVLTACANISALFCGLQLHAHLMKLGYAFDAFVSTTLITFYANCMQMENSSKVFNEILHGNVVTWTALLTGYGLNGKHEEAFRVFRAMINAGIMPNQSTFTSALNCCCELHALDRGKVLHTQTIKLGLDLDVFVGNSLIVMYTRSGCMDDGIASFNNMKKRNVVSWNSIIVGCAHNGHGTLSLELFDQMKCARVPPDEITYVGVLTACSYSRMLEKGRYMFELLIRDPSVKVNLEHCVCMVDLLGRSGKLEEAEKFIMNMPVKPNFTVWMALLSACRVHSNLEVAKRAAQHVLDLDPHNSAGYVLLSNLYASAGWWNEVSTIRQLMEERGFIKQPGSSWLTGEG